MEERHRSLSEVAGLMGVSERTVRRWIKAGRLKAYKPGRDYRIPESAVREFVEGSEISPKAGRRSLLEPSFNDVLEGERRTQWLEAQGAWWGLRDDDQFREAVLAQELVVLDEERKRILALISEISEEEARILEALALEERDGGRLFPLPDSGPGVWQRLSSRAQEILLFRERLRTELYDPKRLGLINYANRLAAESVAEKTHEELFDESMPGAA